MERRIGRYNDYPIIIPIMGQSLVYWYQRIELPVYQLLGSGARHRIALST